LEESPLKAENRILSPDTADPRRQLGDKEWIDIPNLDTTISFYLQSSLIIHWIKTTTAFAL